MKYRKFSDLGWNVSEIGLGCWQIGWCWGDVTDKDARELLKNALDKGVNFLILLIHMVMEEVKDFYQNLKSQPRKKFI